MSNLPTINELYREYEDGLSIKALANKYGIAPETLRYRLRRAGFKMRSLSEAHKLAYQTKRRAPTVKSGADHWAWKGGASRRPYRKNVQKEICTACESRQNLAIHHVDFDHYNNNPDNLQVLCVSCHQSLHKQAYWDSIKAGDEPIKSNGPVGWKQQGSESK